MAKNENTALAIVKEGASELEVKKALYNLVSNAENAFSDCLNKVIKVSAFAFTSAEVTDKQTGELMNRERVVAIDEDGATYHSVSTGLVSSFKNIAQIFGDVHGELIRINPALAIEIKQVKTPKGHTFKAVIVD